ncbi:MAG: thymidylate synthase [Gammaproteobacteria bacterium]
MRQYLDLVENVLNHGERRVDRTGIGTMGLFGAQCRYDLQQGFPLVTTKKIHFRSVAYELLWFLRGETNVRWLQKHGVTIWDEWADAQGELGPVYGFQWRKWSQQPEKSIDQIANLLQGLVEQPYSRRHILSAWNPESINEMALPPCHLMAQFYISDNKLSCQLYQRSADLFLGVPFNIASYALLTHMIAYSCKLDVGEFIHTIGDCHLYLNHLDQAREQLQRNPRDLPRLSILAPANNQQNRLKQLLSLEYEHLKLEGYQPAPHIAAPVAV